MIQVGIILDIKVSDHLIISTEDYLSFREIGLLKQLNLSMKWVPTYKIIERIRKEEAKLRQRMTEMVDDVRLFDSRDETVRPSESAAGISTTVREGYGESGVAWNNADYMSGIGNTLALKQADQLLNLEFRTMPAYDFQDYLTNLDTEKKKLLQAADSLSSVADKYQQKAEQLRKSIQAPLE